MSDNSGFIFGEVTTKASFVHFPSSASSTNRNPVEARRHRSSGEVLVTSASIVLGLALITAIIPNTGWTVILAVVAIFIGNAGFSHLDKAYQLNPPHPTDIIHGTQLFDTLLKDGRNLQITIEIYYSSAQDQPYTLDRIKNQLQRTISSYLPIFKQLPSAPYVELDMLLKADMEILQSQLGLPDLVTRTIEMRIEPGKEKHGDSIRIGSR